jgi:hypothetical protein
MGCPPDPVEVDLSRGNTNSVALKEKADKLINELVRSANFFSSICKQFQQDVSEETNALAKRIVHDSTKFNTEDLGKTFDWNDFPQENSMYPNMSVLYEHLSESEKKVKSIEISLCICRHHLLQTITLIGPEKLSVSDQDVFKEEYNLHLEHRRDDKSTKLKVLEQDISGNRWIIKNEYKRYSEIQIKKAEEEIPLLEAEKRRIEAISDSELLNDRDLF